jgi:hypothetical protein
MDRLFAGAGDTPDEECSRERSATKPETFAPVPRGRISDTPVASGRLTDRAAKYFGTSIFLMKPIAPPVVLLLA